MNSLLLLPAVSLLFIAPLVTAKAAVEAPFPVEMKRETFVSGGRRIHVETFAPAMPGKYPVVLVLHSAAGTLFGKREMEGISRSLAEHGMMAFMVRYFDRTGTVFANDAAIEKYHRVWLDTVHDSLDFAVAHPQVRRDSIGVFGYSLGAFLAVDLASRDARVDAVVELSGGIFDYLGGRLQRVPPMLILQGTADERVDIKYSKELLREAHRLGAQPAVKFYPGEGHVLSPASRADASHRVMTFLQSRLIHHKEPTTGH